MSFAAFDGTRRVPAAVNEPVRSYAPGSPERLSLQKRLEEMAAEQIDIPVVVGGIVPDHDLAELTAAGIAAVLTPGATAEQIVAQIAAVLADD